MKNYIGVYHDEIHYATISPPGFGKSHLVVMKAKDGKRKVVFSNLFNSDVDALMELERRFPDVEWKETHK